MYHSIRSIAKDSGLTREAIYKRLKNIKGFKDKYTTKLHNKLMVNDTGYNVLINSNQHYSKSLTNNTLLKVYKNQIKEKNNQINKLDKLLNQQQQLQLKTQDNYNNLMIKHNHLIKLTSKHTDNSNKQVNTKQHGWIWRLFH